MTNPPKNACSSSPRRKRHLCPQAKAKMKQSKANLFRKCFTAQRGIFFPPSQMRGAELRDVTCFA